VFEVFDIDVGDVVLLEGIVLVGDLRLN